MKELEPETVALASSLARETAARGDFLVMVSIAISLRRVADDLHKLTEIFAAEDGPAKTKVKKP